MWLCFALLALTHKKGRKGKEGEVRDEETEEKIRSKKRGGGGGGEREEGREKRVQLARAKARGLQPYTNLKVRNNGRLDRHMRNTMTHRQSAGTTTY